MRRIVLLVILSLLGCSIKAQDSLISALRKKSDIIVRATVVEMGRRIRMEDGVVEYSVLCTVDERFKGRFRKNDTIRIHITSFSSSLGGKFSDETYNYDSIVKVGASLVFFLERKYYMQTRFSTDRKLEPAYPLSDQASGIQLPTTEIIESLRE